jgi:hypothetical protein
VVVDRHIAVRVDADHGEAGRLQTVEDAGKRAEDEGALVDHGAQRRERDAGPAPVGGAVDVAEEHVADVAVAGDDLPEFGGVGEPDPVEIGDPERHRSVVEEQEGAAVFRGRENAVEPFQPLRAEKAAGLSLDHAVEEDEAVGADIEGGLEKSAGKRGYLRENGAQRDPVVVIPGNRVPRHGKAGERPGERPVGLGLAPVGEIAGDGDERGIGMLLVHVVDRRREPLRGIEPVEPPPRRNEMRIGDVDELEAGHRVFPPVEGGEGRVQRRAERGKPPRAAAPDLPEIRRFLCGDSIAARGARR